MMTRGSWLIVAAVLSALPVVAAPSPIADFNSQIKPIISSKCYHCHGPDDAARKAKLRLDIRDEALKDRKGSRAIVPGKLAESELYKRITTKDPDDVMPPPKEKHPLTEVEVDLLKRWIEQGAPYAEHWAFVKPSRQRLPEVRRSKAEIRNGIDNFVIAKLEAAGLKLSPPADRYALIRRVSLDLIGLPPTSQEVDAFVNDQSRDAYEKLVDRLLASPHFGERWARMWLDLARYADSAGYGSDPLRLNIWPYRDWVINAFNRNLPYDQFTIEQVAGDLLPNATEEMLVATAFHRNTMTNTEGGTDDEEFRVAAVKDRISTTMQTWMGLTFGCAQCHSHKFDPITQTEYYRFFAIFNQTEDNDRPDEFPTMPMPTAEQREKMGALKSRIAELEKEFKGTPRTLEKEVAVWEKNALKPVEWQPLATTNVLGGNFIFETQPDGSVLVKVGANAVANYTVKAKTSLQGITAFRLEVLPDESLPNKGPGFSVGGNFVLSEFKAAAAPVASDVVPRARFVRIENPGKKKMVSLAEVQVFNGSENIARKGKARQSSTGFSGPPELAIDGNTDGDFFKAKSTTHTQIEDNPWWELDLGSEQPVDKLVVWNRTDGNTGPRLNGAKVRLLDAKRQLVFERTLEKAPAKSAEIVPRRGDVSVALYHATADFEQAGFDSAKAIDGDDKTGWAIGGGEGKPHALVVETQQPVNAAGGDVLLTFTLKQDYGSFFNLGRFRLFATTAKPPVMEIPADVRGILATVPGKRTAQQRQRLLAWFKPNSQTLTGITRELQQTRNSLAAIKAVDVPVMRELPKDRLRETHLLNKGNFLTPGDKVEPGLPQAFSPPPKDTLLNRLAVAKWLLSPDNPLTARVAVNRFWAQLFGIGIVETEEDFGTQGALPSHPELLDWLAVEFMKPTEKAETRGPRAEGNPSSRNPKAATEDNIRASAFDLPSALGPRSSDLSPPRPWDIKRLLKLIVTSATYQQSSRITPELITKDPRDRLLSRYPRRRLDAEGVRDQALALSGLLSRKIGGPSVYPPQPDGLWRAAFNGQRTWETSKGEDRYRRGLYTFWRRTVPYPSMATFDAPSRENCTLRRLPTNTPLQAFVTLNDPVYVEMAQALGRRLVREGGASVADRVRYGLRLCLVRPPGDGQVAALVKLYEDELAVYRAQEADAKKLATEPLGALPKDLSVAEAAAWTTVANVLLNLDGVMTKG